MALYHDVLSLSPRDAGQASPALLRELGEAYLARRAPQALAFGVVHLDANLHLHLVISGNLRGRDKKLRLSRREFAAVKRDLEAYQRERYPALAHSLVFGEEAPGKQDTLTETLAEQEQARRQGRAATTRKQALQNRVLRALEQASSPAAFAAALREAGIELYERRGRVTGVYAEGRKHRFRTLGVQHAFEQARQRWEEQHARRQSLRTLVAEKARRAWRARFGYPAQIRRVLANPVGERRRELEAMLGKKHRASPGRGIE